jgi:hypothetical protein
LGAQYTATIEAFCHKDFSASRTFDGQDIRIMRKALDLTQEALARDLDIAVRAVERWEHFLHCPTPSLHKPLFLYFQNAQTQLRQHLIPPSQMESILWAPPHHDSQPLLCTFSDGTFD